jgi:inner membrane transporter RhtA
MRVPSVVLVLAAVTSIQFGAALAATIFDEVSAAGVSLLRLGFAAIVLLAVWRPRLSEYDRPDLRLAALFGLVLGAMNYTFYEALARLPLGIVVTIEFAGPLTVAVLGSRRRLDVFWALLAAALWGLYIVLAARAGQRFRGGRGLALAMGVAALVPLGPGVASGGSALLEPELLIIGLGVALMSSVVPYSLETEALRRMPKNVFGVLMSIEPAVAALAGFLVLEQGLGARDLAAIALVVTASAGATRFAGPGGGEFPEPA